GALPDLLARVRRRGRVRRGVLRRDRGGAHARAGGDERRCPRPGDGRGADALPRRPGPGSARDWRTRTCRVAEPAVRLAGWEPNRHACRRGGDHPGGPGRCWRDPPVRVGGTYISRRPSSAWPSVTSSAYSRSPPTGRPLASRVTRTPEGRSSAATYMAVAFPSR